MIEPTSIASAAGTSGSAAPKPENRAEAARQFEEILVKQLVQAMTDNMFKESLSGEEGPQWMGSYVETQRDVLNEALTEHLIESGTVRLSDLMIRQWNAIEKTTESGNEQ